MNDAWVHLRRYTDARIALGAAGHALPTGRVLELSLAHAQARDAIYAQLDVSGLVAELASFCHRGVLFVQSAAGADRGLYLKRPDLGRQLDATAGTVLEAHRGSGEVVFVVAGGLSPLAVNRHAVSLLSLLVPGLGDSAGAVVVVEQGRVAIGDEIGELLGAKLVVVLIGERPGLSSPDSLGAYLTYLPRAGRTDAERNCVSNIRPEGLPYAAAAHRLQYLIRESVRRQISGVDLKDESEPLLGIGHS